MKPAIIFCLVLFVAQVGVAHTEGNYVPPDPKGPLEEHSLPLTNNAQMAIGNILAHLKCEVDEYFLMSGIDIPKGGSCEYHKKEGRIELKMDRPHLEMALMLIGDLMLHCADDQVTKTQILERYAFAGHPSKSWSRVWMNPADYPDRESDGADQPATAPESKGNLKSQPEAEERCR